MHEDLIRSGQRRLVAFTAVQLGIVVVAIAAALTPIVLVAVAVVRLLDGTSPFGWSVVVIAVVIALAAAVPVTAVVFATAFVRADRDALALLPAWPRPFAGPVASAVPNPPIAEHRRAAEVLEVVSVATGAPPPRLAVLRDDAPNCLVIGRRRRDAWIVVTSGLVAALSRDELEAVLAYELGRVSTMEVSLDTALYASTRVAFDLWAGIFDDLDEAAVLLAPVALVAGPFVAASALLRRLVLGASARLSDGLAIRFTRNPEALVRALRIIERDDRTVRAASSSNAHLWLEYPHTRWSRVVLRTGVILRRRIAVIESHLGDLAG